MASNLDRFEKDLERLITLGSIIERSMRREAYGKEYDAAVRAKMKQDEADEYLNSLPDFKSMYDSWYSEALVLLKQLLPDRVNNFISFYEKPKSRKEILVDNYVIQDFMQGLQVTFAGQIKADQKAAIPQFQQQLAIVVSARARFKSSLFEIRQLVQADLFDSEIDAARELMKNKFYRAAGAISGVILEKHLQQVCDDHNITIKKNPGIGVLNESLKSNSVIDVPQWRHISFLGDIRNICDHSKSQEPTQQQIQDLIDGVEKVMKTIA